MVVFEKVEQRADIGVAFNHLSLFPLVFGGAVISMIVARASGKPRWIPRPSRRQHIRGVRYCRHDIDFDWNSAMFWVLFPAICEDSRLDNLLDDQGGLTKAHCINMSNGGGRGILTPSDPSGRNSRARLTRPYAPRPISPSMRYSEMFRPPRKPWCSSRGMARVC